MVGTSRTLMWGGMKLRQNEQKVSMVQPRIKSAPPSDGASKTSERFNSKTQEAIGIERKRGASRACVVWRKFHRRRALRRRTVADRVGRSTAIHHVFMYFYHEIPIQQNIIILCYSTYTSSHLCNIASACQRKMLSTRSWTCHGHGALEAS